MRAYSRSQGKFIDIPDQVDSSQPVPSQTGGDMSSLTQDTGNDMSMRRLFAMMMLKNPKQASTIKGVFDMLNPQQDAATKKEALNQKKESVNFDQTLKALQDAEDKLNKSGSGIQYIGSGIRSKLPGFLGLNQNAADTISSFSQANTRLFDIAGKAFTGPERKLLEGLVLDITKNKTGNQAAIRQARKYIQDKMSQSPSTQNLLNLVNQQTRPDLSTFEE